MARVARETGIELAGARAGARDGWRRNEGTQTHKRAGEAAQPPEAMRAKAVGASDRTVARDAIETDFASAQNR